MLSRWFPFGKLDCASNRTSMEPAICIDSEGLTGEVAKMSRLLYALEQGKKACECYVRGRKSCCHFCRCSYPEYPSSALDDLFNSLRSRSRCCVG